MSFVSVGPDLVANAAAELNHLGSTLRAANTAAAAATTAMAAPAADEVSAAIATLMTTQAQAYQSVSAQVATFHSEFVDALNAGAGSYFNTEIANANAAASSDITQVFGDGPLAVLINAELEYIELPLDAIGPLVTSTAALGQSGTGFVNAMLAANPDAAMAVLRDVGPNVGHAFLYGQTTVAVPLPSNIPGVSVALNVPFGGLLAPLQTTSVTVTFAAGLDPVTVPFPFEVGGLVTEVQTDPTSVALALLLAPLFLL